MPDDTLGQLTAALKSAPDIDPFPLKDMSAAVFTGCGDSLASALVAERRGYRSLSAGDIEWMGELPRYAGTIAGISLSGTSGAPIRALQRARKAGWKTVAITSSATTPLGQAAEFQQLVPRLDVQERVPVAGHVMLALGVAAACGIDTEGAPSRLARILESDGRAMVDEVMRQLPATLPHAATVLSLPDTRSGANFWTLKLIEGCGIAARDVPLEESGHVDYFIGPQPHLVVEILGRRGQDRFEDLGRALGRNGMTRVRFDANSAVPGESDVDDLLREIVVAVIGALVVDEASTMWGRPPFRGGAVNMDASHITISY